MSLYLKTMIKIAVVDDQCLFRTGLISLLKEFNELDIAIEVSNGQELIQEIEKQKPDVVLLDIEMPVMDGFDTAYYLKKNHPEIKILILTMYNEEDIILHLISKGAHGFLLKNDPIKVVVDAIHAVLGTGYYFNDRVSKSMVRGLVSNKKIKPHFKSVSLSEREIEIVRLIGKEYTNKEIADRLFVSVRTIDGHREKILEKTKARNTAGIVMYAVKNNLLPIMIKSKKLI